MQYNAASFVSPDKDHDMSLKIPGTRTIQLGSIVSLNAVARLKKMARLKLGWNIIERFFTHRLRRIDQNVYGSTQIHCQYDDDVLQACRKSNRYHLSRF